MKSIGNTTIRFGLISLPAQVCAAATTADDVSFEQAGPEGQAINQVYIDPADTNNKDGLDKTYARVVERDTIQKGVWTDQGFTPVAKEALTTITEATKMPDLGILDVIDRDTIPVDRITGKYFIQSAKKGGNINAFKLFVDSLADEGLACVTKWTARSRQKLMVLVPEDGNLVGYALAFADDMRMADEGVEAHQAGSYTNAEADMARQLLRSMRSEESKVLAEEVDEAIALKENLYHKAIAGKEVTVPKRTEQPEADTSLADALGQMLAQQAKEKELREKAAA